MDRDAIREMILYLNAKINEKEHQLERAQGLAGFWMITAISSMAGLFFLAIAKFFTGEP